MIGDEEEGIIKERERERRPLGVKEKKMREQELEEMENAGSYWDDGEEEEVSLYANRFIKIGTGAQEVSERSQPSQLVYETRNMRATTNPFAPWRSVNSSRARGGLGGQREGS